MLYATKRTESGRAPSALWFRRMIVLLGIGLLHAYLLWPGDILVPYTFCGILLLWSMRNRSARTLLISAIGMLTIGAASAVRYWLGWSSMSDADRAAELELMMPTREQAGHIHVRDDVLRAVLPLARVCRPRRAPVQGAW